MVESRSDGRWDNECNGCRHASGRCCITSAVITNKSPAAHNQSVANTVVLRRCAPCCQAVNARRSRSTRPDILTALSPARNEMTNAPPSSTSRALSSPWRNDDDARAPAHGSRVRQIAAHAGDDRRRPFRKRHRPPGRGKPRFACAPGSPECVRVLRHAGVRRFGWLPGHPGDRKRVRRP
jgi:uncharacterized cysteine cluster protein YcgN (CxxCxxCC family)